MFTNKYKKDIEIIYTGYSLNSSNLSDLLDYIKDKRLIVNVISKSGNTMEVNFIFSKVLESMKSKYNEKELKKRIEEIERKNRPQKKYTIKEFSKTCIQKQVIPN